MLAVAPQRRRAALPSCVPRGVLSVKATLNDARFPVASNVLRVFSCFVITSKRFKLTYEYL